jgi:hypothetical protein
MKSHRSTPNHSTTSSPRRWLVVAASLVAGCIATPSASASSTATESRPIACFWEPAANVLSFGPELVETVRMVGAEVEILHRVSCTNDTERWLWMPASYDGCPS